MVREHGRWCRTIAVPQRPVHCAELGQFPPCTSIFAMMKRYFWQGRSLNELHKRACCHIKDLPGFSTEKYFLKSMQCSIRSQVIWYN